VRIDLPESWLPEIVPLTLELQLEHLGSVCPCWEEPEERHSRKDQNDWNGTN
jgi:hypothetical protein